MKDGEVKEQGLVEEIFSHPKSQVAKELISKDSGNDVESKKLPSRNPGRRNRSNRIL